MTNTAWTTSWNSYMHHHLNIQACRRDTSRSHPKVVAMDWFTAHQLRHTYATMLYDAGVDVKTAQDFLGHADPTVTMNILHPSFLTEKGKRDPCPPTAFLGYHPESPLKNPQKQSKAAGKIHFFTGCFFCKNPQVKPSVKNEFVVNLLSKCCQNPKRAQKWIVFTKSRVRKKPEFSGFSEW